MEFIRGVHNLRDRHRGCLATIGNFDGVHLGHQAVLAHLRTRAAAVGIPSQAIIFEPQPVEFFSADPPPRITRLREKLQALDDCGVDRVLCIRFDRTHANRTAHDFVEQLLVGQLGIRELVVGPDFRFGKDRRGDIDLLKQAGARFGFTVTHLPPVLSDTLRVSSTAVRGALRRGDFKTAEALLGRPYRISGRVSHGDARGRTIGFPTLNLRLHRRRSCLRGVFAVQVWGLETQALPGVANIGTRPTVDGSETVLEVHLLDFAGTVYGTHVDVEFLSRLRDERRFSSLDALKQQIGQDVTDARRYLARMAEETGPRPSM